MCGEAFVPMDALERLSYLIAAQAGIGYLAVVAGGVGMTTEELDREDDEHEARSKILAVMARVSEPQGTEGHWL